MSRIAESAFGDRPYPESPGFKVDGTSREAARAVAKGSEAVKLEILRLLRLQPRTADEMATAINRSVLYTRPRLAELASAKDGRARKTKLRRKNESGLSASIYEATGK